jgi:2-keto-4-pentenoate hydratase/2-oxohepta-3-ene-1,7-dioic acid hydratase in catechol pathway
VIARTCKNVNPPEWLDFVAGFVSIIDMTAEDILRKNPRYLTLAKSFDTFFSCGPWLVTPDEIEDVLALEVATVINGKVHACNQVRNMTFTPDMLVAFHSGVMTLLPGDIISTGTPGAAVLKDGDHIACRISGFKTLENPVRDLKRV